MTARRHGVDSPLGPLTLCEQDGALVSLDWRQTFKGEPSDLLSEAERQLAAYFDGRLKTFDLPVAPHGTAHQRAVWQTMQTIPFGGTMSYGALASAIGSSPRAVGTACGRNPIPIIVPCHRVLAAGDQIGGYSGAGGLATKRFLLALEGVPISA